VNRNNYPTAGDDSRCGQGCYDAWLVATHLPTFASRRMADIPGYILAHIQASHGGNTRLQRIDHLQWLVYDIQDWLEHQRSYTNDLTRDLDILLVGRVQKLIITLAGQPDHQLTFELLFGGDLSSLSTQW